MPQTYEPIATTTLGSAAATIDFTSIPSTYTDLRLVFVGYSTFTSLNTGAIRLRFNADTGANYSDTYLYANGTSLSSSRETSATSIYAGQIPDNVAGTSIVGIMTADVFSYAGSTNKTVLTTSSSELNTNNTLGTLTRTVGLWRNTAAITSITMVAGDPNFNIGTTATLYGIKNA
jgi:hypothetical protein